MKNKKWDYKGNKVIEEYVKHIANGDSSLLVKTPQKTSILVADGEDAWYLVKTEGRSRIKHYVAIIYVQRVSKIQQVKLSKIMDELNSLVTFPKIVTCENGLVRTLCLGMYCYGPYSDDYFPKLFRHFKKQIKIVKKNEKVIDILDSNKLVKDVKEPK